MNERQCAIGELAEFVKGLEHGVAKPWQVTRPTIASVNLFDGRIEEIEYLFVIAFAFGELAVVVAHGVIDIASDFIFDCAISIKKPSCLLPGSIDEVVKSVAAQKEKPVVAACRIKSVKRRGSRAGNINDRHGKHMSCWHKRTLRGNGVLGIANPTLYR